MKKSECHPLCPSAHSWDFSLCFMTVHQRLSRHVTMATSCLFSWRQVLSVCVQSAVQSLPNTFTLSLHHKSVFECLCAVCSMSMSEELLICGPLRSILSVFLSHAPPTHTLTHTHCQIRAAAHRVVWSLAWELGRIRQAAAVWYSCHHLFTAGVARHSLKFNQSPPVLKPRSTPTLDPWRPPFAPVTHTLSSHRKTQPQALPSPSEHLPFCSLHEALRCSHRSITHTHYSTHSTTHLHCWDPTPKQ